MKKIFMLMLSLSVMCTIAFAKVTVEELKLDGTESIRETVNADIKEKIDGYNVSNVSNDVDSNSLIHVVTFRQTVLTEGDKNISNPEKECIAVVIDDAWAVASRKCFLSKGEKLFPMPGIVKSSSISDPKIIISDKEYKVSSYVFNNVILLRTVNENGNPLFTTQSSAKLAFVTSADMSEFTNKFNEGSFEINRTNKHKSAYDDAHDVYENHFHSYYNVDRKTYKKEIDSVYQDEKSNRVLAKVNSTLLFPKLLRAGDPLFYVKDGSKYLLGFGNATNLWDNADNTRSDEAILLTDKDIEKIISIITDKDSKAAERIKSNML